jgi:cation transport ATPase
MTTGVKYRLNHILRAVVLFLIALIVDKYFQISGYQRLLLFVVPYVLMMLGVFLDLAAQIVKGHLLSDELCMLVASMAVLCLNRYVEAFFLLFLFEVGRVLRAITSFNVEQEIRAKIERIPSYLRVEEEEEEEEQGVWKYVLVDFLDLPRGQIAECIETIASRYSIGVLILAVFLFLVPTAFGIGAWQDWLYRGILFVVTACPCGQLYSLSLALLDGIAEAKSEGVFIKDCESLKKLSCVDLIFYIKKSQFAMQHFPPKDYVTREENAEAVEWFQSESIDTILLTDEDMAMADAIAEEYVVDVLFDRLNPDEMLAQYEEVLANRWEEGCTALIEDSVGCELTDYPADLRVSVGKRMHADCIDVSLLENQPYLMMRGIQIAQGAMRHFHENLIYTIGMKSILLLLAAVGGITIATAMIANVVILLVGLLNSHSMGFLGYLRVGGVKRAKRMDDYFAIRGCVDRL